jgi:hypothetical protein
MKLEFIPIKSFLGLNRQLGWRFGLILAVALLLYRESNALYLGNGVIAKRVSDGSIVMDGRPDLVWKAIGARLTGADTISFGDYQKIVLLQSDAIRNANPAKHYLAPAKGSVSMMAAYDNTALYFFFLVKENSFYNPASLCTATNLWKANAAEVYIDPSPWVTVNYNTYFSVDGSSLLNGTSPKTVQLDKPIYPGDTRLFFRNRTTPPDRFQIPVSLPNGVMAISSSHTIKGDSLFGVEMKIPFWTGNPNDFSQGKSMFISWGYNHYPGTSSNCDSTPIAYRWAKHYKTYASYDLNKPYGWRAGDSTHFDPTRSWDGWGQLFLSLEMANGTDCRFLSQDTGSWELATWRKNCSSAPTVLRQKSSQPILKNQANSKINFPWDSPARDLRGRSISREGSGREVEIRPWLYSRPTEVLAH